MIRRSPKLVAALWPENTIQVFELPDDVHPARRNPSEYRVHAWVDKPDGRQSKIESLQAPKEAVLDTGHNGQTGKPYDNRHIERTRSKRKGKISNIGVQDQDLSKNQTAYETESRILGNAREKMQIYFFHWGFWSFIILCTVLALAEPVLIGLQETLPYSAWLGWQLKLLAASSLLHGLLLTVTYYWIGVIDARLGWLQKLRILSDGESIFETACLTLGWIFLWSNPGIAALRCMRIFRMLWFFELGEHKKIERPEDRWVSISNSCYICVQYLEGIGSEIFTAKSKGGLVLLAIYFYVTYIFAAIFYIEDRTRIVTPSDVNPTTGNNTLCGTLTGCYLTMLRLTLYDGAGAGPSRRVPPAAIARVGGLPSHKMARLRRQASTT